MATQYKTAKEQLMDRQKLANGRDTSNEYMKGRGPQNKNTEGELQIDAPRTNVRMSYKQLPT